MYHTIYLFQPNSTPFELSKTLKAHSEVFLIIVIRSPIQGDLGIKRLSANKILRSFIGDDTTSCGVFSLERHFQASFF